MPLAMKLPLMRRCASTCLPRIFRFHPLILPLAPLHEAQQHGEESEYADEGKGDCDRVQRRLLSLSCDARDDREVSTPKITKPPVIFPNRNQQSHDAAKDQRKAEVPRGVGKARRSYPGHLLHAIEELDDGETEPDQRYRRSNPRHH